MGHGSTPGSLDQHTSAVQIDDGTLARTDSPQPGPIGLDAHTGGGSTRTTPNISASIVGFARRLISTRLGNGECFTLVDRALSSAGARSAADFGTVAPDADYKWGTSEKLADLQPGDIIQFRDYRFDREIDVNNPDGSGSTDTDFQERPHHTAIVESVDGNGAVTVLEQNAPQGSAVTRSHLFFTDTTTTDGSKKTTIKVKGSFWFYRPQAR